MASSLLHALSPKPILGHVDISARERSIKITVTRTLSRDRAERHAEIESIKRIFNDSLAQLLAKLEG